MTEVFIALGAAAGGGAAAGAGAAVAGGVAASTITTVLSIGSALASIGSGIAARNAAIEQANQVATQDAQSRAADAQKRATMAEEYAQIMADQQAVQIANGLNPGVGTPASIRRGTTEFADRNLSISRENTLNRSRVARMQRRALLSEGNAALFKGFINAAGTGLDLMQAVG